MLALGDIPEVESHKLSELCRILNASEGLFVEDHNQVRIFQVTMTQLKSSLYLAFLCPGVCTLMAQIFVLVGTFGQCDHRFSGPTLTSILLLDRKLPWRISLTFLKLVRWSTSALTSSYDLYGRFSRIRIYGPLLLTKYLLVTLSSISLS